MITFIFFSVLSFFNVSLSATIFYLFTRTLSYSLSQEKFLLVCFSLWPYSRCILEPCLWKWPHQDKSSKSSRIMEDGPRSEEMIHSAVSHKKWRQGSSSHGRQKYSNDLSKNVATIFEACYLKTFKYIYFFKIQESSKVVLKKKASHMHWLRLNTRYNNTIEKCLIIPFLSWLFWSFRSLLNPSFSLYSPFHCSTWTLPVEKQPNVAGLAKRSCMCVLLHYVSDKPVAWILRRLPTHSCLLQYCYANCSWQATEKCPVAPEGESSAGGSVGRLCTQARWKQSLNRSFNGDYLCNCCQPKYVMVWLPLWNNNCYKVIPAWCIIWLSMKALCYALKNLLSGQFPVLIIGLLTLPVRISFSLAIWCKVMWQMSSVCLWKDSTLSMDRVCQHRFLELSISVALLLLMACRCYIRGTYF